VSIMLAGNVHANPGPSTVRWLCPTCGQSAHYRSVQCINRRCRRWYHIKCTDVIDVKRLDTVEVWGMQRVMWTCGDCIAAATAAQNVSNCEPTVHPVPESTQANAFTMPPVRVNGPCRQQRRRYRWRNFPKVADEELLCLPRSKRLKQRGHKTEQEFNIIYWNCADVRSKTAQLYKLISDTQPSVVMLQETNLDEEAKYRPPRGYNCIRQNRTVTRSAEAEKAGLAHGCVLMLIH